MTNLTRASLAENPSATVSATPRDRHWDFLLVCVAAYLTTAVGRVHQLFPLLSPLKPVFVSAALAIVLYVVQQGGARRIRWVRSPTTTHLLLLLLWVALSVPGALHQGLAFSLLTNFMKTVALYVLIVGSVRGFRDLERLAFVYFAAASVFSVVVLTRFPVGGNNWRLGGLYYYDANDFAVFAVTAVPLGLYFGLTQTQLHRRLVSLGGVLAVLIAFIWSGSRGGFLAMLAVVAFLLFRYTAMRLHWRLLTMALIIATGWLTASDRYWTQMATILQADNDYNRTELNGREKIWRRGIGYMLSHPVFGVGASNFGVAEDHIAAGPAAGARHWGSLECTSQQLYPGRRGARRPWSAAAACCDRQRVRDVAPRCQGGACAVHAVACASAVSPGHAGVTRRLCRGRILFVACVRGDALFTGGACRRAGEGYADPDPPRAMGLGTGGMILLTSLWARKRAASSVERWRPGGELALACATDARCLAARR